MTDRQTLIAHADLTDTARALLTMVVERGRIAVSIIDRMRTLPRERARRFHAVADMLGGWQLVTTGETRVEALKSLAKLIKDNGLAEVEA